MRLVRAIDPLGRAPSSSPPVLRSTLRCGGGGHPALHPATIPVSPISASLARSLHPFPLPLFRRRRRQRRRHHHHSHGGCSVLLPLFSDMSVSSATVRRRTCRRRRRICAARTSRCAHDDGGVVLCQLFEKQ